ncbi:MAG: alanine--tRNA ligase-related protein [Candidatus Hermodarchaeota archaeon]
MTRKLYWEDPYETKFTATVLSIQENGVVLDKTLFYPESGNQSSDRGTLRTADVEFKIEIVTKEDNEIVHNIPSEFKDKLRIGTKVAGEIDWEHRYGLMKAHSSQHIFSAVLKNKYNIDTMRAILNFEDVYLQISQKIDYNQLKEVLYEVNKVFTSQNSLISAKIIPYNQAKEIANKIRSQIPNEPEVRLIEIENLDLVCCGGTHVQNTVEIGNIFVYDFKKGNEIRYYVGNKSVINSSDLNINLINLANGLNVSAIKLVEIVKKRLELLDILQNKQKELSYQFLDVLSKSPNTMINDVQLFYFNFEIDIKILNKSLDYFPQNSVIIGKIGDDKLRILSLSEKVDANGTLQEIIRVYGGKGGGNTRSAQAALKKMPKDLLSEIEQIINKELGVK